MAVKDQQARREARAKVKAKNQRRKEKRDERAKKEAEERLKLEAQAKAEEDRMKLEAQAEGGERRIEKAKAELSQLAARRWSVLKKEAAIDVRRYANICVAKLVAVEEFLVSKLLG